MAARELTICAIAVWTASVIAPPPLQSGAGGFSAARVERPPQVDGGAWTAVDVSIDPARPLVVAPNRRFSLALREPDQDTGDFTRYEVWFQRPRSAAVRIDSEFAGWVYVTPDSKYVFSEPLFVLDVRRWTRYALHDVLNIPNYTNIAAISRDRRRLLISRRDCAIDCRGDEREEYFELTMPR